MQHSRDRTSAVPSFAYHFHLTSYVSRHYQQPTENCSGGSMMKAAETSFRRLGATVAIAFLASIVACEPRSFSPESTVQVRRPAVMQIPRARVIEPGDLRKAILPGADLELGGSVGDLVNTAFDATASRVWILETRTQQLLEMSVGPNGSADRSTMRVVDARGFGLRVPRGLTVDPASGQLFVLDVGPRIVRLEPHPT